MRCTHDIFEMETAIADGYCPICNVAKIKRLRAVLKPFAEAAVDTEGYADDHPPGCDPQMELSIKIHDGASAPLKVLHLRAAADALDQTGDKT